MQWQLRKGPSQRGFTLIEALVVVAILGVILLLGLPSLFNYIRRAKVEGTIQGVANLMRLARFEAIKQGVPVVVRADYGQGLVSAYVDRNNNQTFDPTAGVNPRATDREIGRIALANGVFFWGVQGTPIPVTPAISPGPANAAPKGASVVAGFTPDPGGGPSLAVFDPTGTIRANGSFEFGDGRGNFIEVGVSPTATARVSLWKWNRADSVYYQRGNAAPGGGTDSGKTTWEWY
jgi:prepilin-type N-terminal cleavage/methylation domain-containing protein